MKKVGFIGACDKTNIIMYVAKVLTGLNYRVLVIDTTRLQRTRYIIPTINPTKSYITEFDRVDFAVGFQSIEEIEYKNYDFVLIDIDSLKALYNFNIENGEDNYFVTSFDMYSLRKGATILQNIEEPLKLTKILYSYDVRKEDEEYLKYLLLETKIVWDDSLICVPMDLYDNQLLEDNQRMQKMKMKKLSSEFQNSICYIVQNILKEKNINIIKRSIRE